MSLDHPYVTMDLINVIVIRNGLISENHLFDSAEKAEEYFLDQCQSQVSNWDEYDQADKDASLEAGCVNFGTGNSIQISWPELHISKSINY